MDVLSGTESDWESDGGRDDDTNIDAATTTTNESDSYRQTVAGVTTNDGDIDQSTETDTVTDTEGDTPTNSEQSKESIPSKECHSTSDYARRRSPVRTKASSGAERQDCCRSGDIRWGHCRWRCPRPQPGTTGGIEAGRNRLETPSRTCRNHCLAGSRSTWAQAQSDRNFEGFLPRLYKGTGGSWSDDHRPANSRLEIMTEVPRG